MAEGVWSLARHLACAPSTISREIQEISRGVAMAEGVWSLVRHLACAPSTISREIQRHGGGTR